jgi:hypothetical protein
MAYNLDKMKETVASARTGVFWRPKQGKNLIRVLPGIEGKTLMDGKDLFFFGRQENHRIPKADQGFDNFTCLKPKWCPACTMASLLGEMGKKEAKDVQARTSWALNICTGPEEPVLIWNPSGEKMEDMFAILSDGDWGDFTSPAKGFCLAVHRKGQGSGTRYTIAGTNQKFKFPRDWKEEAHNLNVGNVKTRSQIVDLLVDKYEDRFDNIASEIMSRRPKRRAPDVSAE